MYFQINAANILFIFIISCCTTGCFLKIFQEICNSKGDSQNENENAIIYV